MNIKLTFGIALFFGLSVHSFGQKLKPGTYMSLYATTHYTVYQKDAATIRIEPCQKFGSQFETDKETYEFKKLANTEKFGWNGGTQIILEIDGAANILSFANPMDMRIPMKLMLLHPENTLPAAHVKTYYDETQGGHSNARILVTDPAQINSGNCYIHSTPSTEFNGYIPCNYKGLFGNGFSATFRADHTGTFNGLAIKWSIVSDHNGRVKKWDYSDGGFLLHLMIEFENELPVFVDKPSAGKKLAILEALRYSKDDGTIEILQMQKQ